MPFPQVNTRRMAAIRLALVLWRSCWWCSRRMTKRSSPAGLGRGKRGAVREGYKVVALFLKPSWISLDLWAGATPRVCHPPPDCTRVSKHSPAHPGTLWCWLSSLLVALTWNHTKDHNRCRKLYFHHPGHVPVIRGNPDLHFEGAGNGPVIISWIGRGHELYSGVSPISLVEHYVTFRHDRRLLSLWGFVHNWPTSRLSATKKKTGFHQMEMESCRLF